MHPLLDRRDITAARNVQGEAGGGESGALIAVAAELAATNQILQRLVREFNASSLEICVTDRQPAQLRMRNFPVPGTDRLIVRRTGEGGTFSVPQNVPVTVAAPNENRLGGFVVNSGAQAVTLFLAADLQNSGGSTLPMTSGTPQIFLPANAVYPWGFELGNTLWCGSVIALCTNAAGSTVVVAEV